MTQAAKAQEPSMEEILASIRRIIADDDATKSEKPAKPAEQAAPAPPAAAAPSTPPQPVPSRPAAPPAAAAAPAPQPSPPPQPKPAVNTQQDIDAMVADLDAPPKVAAAPAPSPMAAAPAPAGDVFDLTEAMAAPEPQSMAVPEPPASDFHTIDAASDVVFAERAPEPTPVDSLMSSTTRAAVDSAFHSLANTVLGQNARTLEDLVKEMLRPMLKGWLDENLPSMVERIVRAEIERVSRGR